MSRQYPGYPEHFGSLLERYDEDAARATLAAWNVPANERRRFCRFLAVRYAAEHVQADRRALAFRIVARYGCSLRTAYARIDEALAQGPRICAETPQTAAQGRPIIDL